MPVFTRENARDFALRGNAVRWSREKAPADPPAITPQIAATVADDGPRLAALARVLRQLDSLDALMDHAKDAKDWDMLSRAKERLAKVWFHLGGIAGPGNLRPSRSRDDRRASPLTTAEPTLPATPPIPPLPPQPPATT